MLEYLVDEIEVCKCHCKIKDLFISNALHTPQYLIFLYPTHNPFVKIAM